MIAFDIFIVALLIAICVILFVLELFFLPGITIAGIAGLLFGGGAVYYAFTQLGSTAGYLTIIIGVIAAILAIIWFAKSKTLKKIALNKEIDSVANELLSEKDIPIGTKGVTLSRLNPIGKVLVNGETYEAKSNSEFIDQETPIEVIEVLTTSLLVKPIEKEDTK